MRAFVCTVFWAVCLQLNVLLPPSWLMAAMLAVAVMQDIRDLRPRKDSE